VCSELRRSLDSWAKINRHNGTQRRDDLIVTPLRAGTDDCDSSPMRRRPAKTLQRDGTNRIKEAAAVGTCKGMCARDCGTKLISAWLA